MAAGGRLPPGTLKWGRRSQKLGTKKGEDGEKKEGDGKREEKGRGEGKKKEKGREMEKEKREGA